MSVFTIPWYYMNDSGNSNIVKVMFVGVLYMLLLLGVVLFVGFVNI